MYSPDAVRNIIRIALQPLTASHHPLYTPNAEEIMMMASAHESLLGKHLRQIGGGDGLGLFQVEPRTAKDNYTNFLMAPSRRLLAEQIEQVSGVYGYNEQQLQFNPIYGAIHARLKLYRSPGALPSAHDPWAMAEYLKDNFNSNLGSATPEKYFADYHRLVMAA